MDRLKIVVIGGDSAGLKALRDKGFDVVSADYKLQKEIDNSFDINGIKYKPKEEVSISDIRANMMAESLGMYVRRLNNEIDIVKEFGLIQVRKSKLSRWERLAVARRFNSEYEKVN